MVATSQIREHMEIIGSDGAHVGTVDHLDGEDRIKLTKGDSSDGSHHFIPVDWVDHIDAHVHLNKASDEVMDEWEGDDEADDADDAGEMDEADSEDPNRPQ